jgi:DNA-binding GntR family transcriptional regulator
MEHASVVKTGSRRLAGPEHIYQKLRELIVRGQLAPGTRIVETDVASKLGMSRTPVRSALQRLQQEGYIVHSRSLRQSRPTVAPLTKEDAAELFSIVAEIEGLASRFATALRPANRGALSAELVAINTRLRKASKAKTPNHDLLWELDERFHRRYVEAGAGPRLRALHDAVKPQAERYERLYVSLLAHDMRPSINEHAAIARAIKSGDPDVAQLAVQTNWRNAAERLGEVIDRVGERGKW